MGTNRRRKAQLLLGFTPGWVPRKPQGSFAGGGAPSWQLHLPRCCMGGQGLALA